MREDLRQKSKEYIEIAPEWPQKTSVNSSVTKLKPVEPNSAESGCKSAERYTFFFKTGR